LVLRCQGASPANQMRQNAFMFHAPGLQAYLHIRAVFFNPFSMCLCTAQYANMGRAPCS
jgi:hypothetical protein